MKLLHDIAVLPPASKKYLLSQFLSAFYCTWPIFILYMMKRFDVFAAGVYYSALSLTDVIAEIPAGYIADRIGQAKSVLMGALLNLVFLVLLVSIDSPLMPLITGIGMGLGTAFISGAADALIYKNLTHKEYEDTMHHNVTVWQAGLITSAILGGLLYKIAPALPFVAQGVLQLVGVLPLLSLRDVFDGGDDKPTIKDAAKALRHIFKTKASLIFLAGSMVYGLVIDLFINFLLETRMIELGVSPATRGAVIGGTKIAILIALQFLVLRRVNTVGKKLVLTLVMMLTVLPLMGLGNSAWLFAGMYLLFNLTTALSNAVINPMRQKLVASKYRATELSLYELMRSAAFAVGSLVLGQYLSHHMTRGVFFVLSFAALVIALPALLWSLAHYHGRVRADLEQLGEAR